MTPQSVEQPRTFNFAALTTTGFAIMAIVTLVFPPLATAFGLVGLVTSVIMWRRTRTTVYAITAVMFGLVFVAALTMDFTLLSTGTGHLHTRPAAPLR
jgi:hypothetical protein